MIDARLRKNHPPGPHSAAFSLDVAFQASTGVTVLFGPSGSGKTLTLDCVAGFVRPDAGRILLDDRLLYDGPTQVHLAPRARRTGYVFQSHALFPHMTLRGNLDFALAGLPSADRRRRIREMLERFRLADVAGRRPHQLSGGQKQRCSIARALIGEPRLLLLDEPARGLDAPLRSEFYELLRQARAGFDAPALLVTHDLDECFELGDHMLILHKGRIIQTGTPRAILNQPANLDVARLLGRHNLMPVEIRALDPGRNTSRLRYEDFEIAGPYFPAHLIGDHVSLCTLPEDLQASPRVDRPSPGQVPVELLRAVQTPTGHRLEFSGGITVAVRTMLPNPPKEWIVEFPPAALRIV